MFHDMRVTLDAIVKSLRNAKIGKNQETVYGAFYDKIMKIHGNFSDMIENIDLNARTANGNQFDAAFLAYKEGKVAFLYGQFRRQFERILKEHPPVSSLNLHVQGQWTDSNIWYIDGQCASMECIHVI